MTDGRAGEKVFEDVFQQCLVVMLRGAERVEAGRIEKRVESWKQTFEFDRYGNRRFDQSNTTMPASFANPAVTNPTISPNTNKITSTGYAFDAAGNTTRDASDRKFIYDSENKQVKVESLSAGTQTVTGTVGEYVYDGDGRRVKKRAYENNVLTEETVFVYDASGKLVAEYSNEIASAQDAKVAYLTSDHLGSPRITTDINGKITARHDYHPFGEEIETSQRTPVMGYGGDGIRKQFAGYEQDEESDLDFAQARFYQRESGRYNSPDPLLNSAEVASPQSWHRYVYTLNNPTNLIDPLGLFVWGSSLGGSLSDAALNESGATGRRIVERRNRIRNALNDAAEQAADGAIAGRLSSQQAGAVFDAINAYGNEGQVNGVTVAFGNVEEGDAVTSWQTNAEGRVTPFSTDDEGRVTALVVVTFEEGQINARNAAHEGSHTRDRQLLAKALEDPTAAGVEMPNRPQNITKYETERRAYNITSFLDQATNSPSTVWQPRSSDLDRSRSIDSHIRAVNRVSPPRTEPGPGGRLFQETQPLR